MTHHLYPTPPFSPNVEGTLYPSNDSMDYTTTSTPYSTVSHDGYFSGYVSPAQVHMPNRLHEESTQQMLESLVTFYHQGRMWIYHARESLEAESAGILIQGQPVKMERDDEDSGYGELSDVGERRPLRSRKQQTMAARRRATNLHLNGSTIAPGRPNGQARAGGGIERHKNPTEILDMFERMLASRMESCERVNRLVRDASGYR